jgi:hypothetical protein
MDRDALKRELAQDFEQSLDQVMDAVQRAPDGAWIAASEWQVREAFQELMARAFERVLQARLDAAGGRPAAFSPSGPSGPAKQGPTGPERADGRG